MSLQPLTPRERLLETLWRDTINELGRHDPARSHCWWLLYRDVMDVLCGTDSMKAPEGREVDHG